MLSMTGFGRGRAESENWRASVTIRSLNGKGLEISLKIPPLLMSVEQKAREVIKGKLTRGTVHVVVEFEPKRALPPVDLGRLAENVSMLRRLSKEELGLSVSDDLLFELSWRHSEKLVHEVDEELEATILSALEEALRELLRSKEREGMALKEDLLRRVGRVEELLSKIEERKDAIIERVKEKVLERAKSLELPREHPTVLNEMMFLLERMDVEEEITRLKTHLLGFRHLLEEGRDVGKRLEFLTQEMHREITTLGNKLPDLSEYVVEIKAEIDRMKQQSANVE